MKMMETAEILVENKEISKKNKEKRLSKNLKNFSMKSSVAVHESENADEVVCESEKDGNRCNNPNHVLQSLCKMCPVVQYNLRS